MFDQDYQQLLESSLCFLTELVRSFSGSFLVLTVPQMCANNHCSIVENFVRHGDLNTAILVSNAVTFSCIVLMYIIEHRRECCLIDLMHVDPSLPPSYLTSITSPRYIDYICREDLFKIKRNNAAYIRAGWMALITFSVNTAVSLSALIEVDDVSLSACVAFTTTVSFLGTKLYGGVLPFLLKPRKHRFVSAYLTQKTEFNAIDPDRLLR